jgi:hypothetical protein
MRGNNSARIAAKEAAWYEFVRVHVALIALGLCSPLWVGTTERPIVVLVPEESATEACFADERMSAVIALTPGVRLLRGRMQDNETIEAARQRSNADLAIRGARVVKDGVEEATIEIARADRAIEKRTLSGSIFDRVESVLESSWPKDAPPLQRIERRRGRESRGARGRVQARCGRRLSALRCLDRTYRARSGCAAWT